MQRWQDALAMFNSLQGRPVQMDSSGPWGGAFTMVPLDRLIAYCREKISPGSGTDPHAFTVKSTPIHSDYTFAFAPDSSGLWVAAGSVLMRLNLDLQTNVVIDLPMAQDVSSTTLQVGDAKIWVGTAGAGLIEVDLTTRQSRVFTEKDGLLMNDIRSLHADDGIIWIGYGNTVGGGLGRFELASRQARTFMASLGDKGTAPQGAIDDIVEVQAGHLLIKAGEGLWQFDTRSETWASVGNGFRCCAVDGDRFVRGTADPIQEYQFEHAPCSNPVAGMANSNAMVSLIPHGAVPERPFGPVFPPRHAGYVKQTVYGTMDELKKFMMTNAGWNILAEASGEEGYECGVSVRSGTNGEWQNFADAMAMPYAANAMNLDGENLWIGGEGYLTLLDLHRHTFRRLCSLQAVAVNKIKIGGGYVWLDYGQRLHRAALSQLP